MTQLTEKDIKITLVGILGKIERKAAQDVLDSRGQDMEAKRKAHKEWKAALEALILARKAVMDILDEELKNIEIN